MLALQTMSTPKDSPRERDTDKPLANVTNGSTATARSPQQLDTLSNQILTLTNIATSLQKEMSQLSRRSRDNATDLLSLKEATHTRDEDIRKHLRDLLHNMEEVSSRTSSRDMHGGPLLLDNKPYSLSPSSKISNNSRPFALPRIPSPNSFSASLDRENLSTPSLYGGDASASVNLLEKIIRDMGTKDGQEKLLTRLSDLADKLNGSVVEKKVEDLQRLIKNNMDQSVVLSQPGGSGAVRGKAGLPRNMSFDEASDLYGGRSLESRVDQLVQDKDARRASAPMARAAADLISDDIVKIIRTVKDSVAQGGGLTAEVKALVRELRGEVLGMGREIGRRLDDVGEASQAKSAAATKAEINKVVGEGLLEMKQHIDYLTSEHQRQSQAVVAANKPPAVDYREIYNALRTALKDAKALQKDAPELRREDVVEAVRDAWERYKPEITVEQVGLERDEVLACLKEGFMQYAPKDNKPEAATREEVFKAVVEGLQHFSPPPINAPPALSRDEIVEAVRDCLEEFEFPVAASALGADLSKQDMIDAVKQGLETLELSAKDKGPLVPLQGNNEEIIGRLHEIMEAMHEEFKAVSLEAKQNVAANGRDTEQVLDATKDGFEKLRADIEGYVDRANGVTSQEEFMEGLLRSLDDFRDEIGDIVSKQADGSRVLIKEEIEALRESVNGTLVPVTPQAQQGGHEEVINALQEGLGNLRQEISQRPIAGTNEVLDALQEGLNDLKISIEKIADKPADMTANDEVLDALKSGLDSVKSDIEGLRENSKALAPISADAIVPADMLKHDDIKNLEVLISQLRIKVEAMESPAPQPAPAPADPGPSLTKEDLDLMVEMLDSIKIQVDELASKETPAPNEGPAATDAATREDIEAIETILRNTKARLDDLMDGEQAVRKDHVDALEVLILETKEGLGGLTTKLEDISHREDTKAVESLVTQVVGAFDELKERHEKQLEDPEKVTKTDTDAIEAVCLDVKAVVEQMVKSDIAALPSKDDLKSLETLVTDLKELSDKQNAELKEATEKHATELKEATEKHATELKELADKHAETNAKQFEERQAETVGVGDRVTEVKTFLEEMQAMVKEKLEGGATGVEGLSKSLETLGETIGANANVHSDLKEMFDTMKTEFEDSKAGVVGAKLETDEKLESTTETLRAKIDERIDEVITKYDEFQNALEERNKTAETRDEHLEESVIGTKAVAEELKTLIDTLGSTVTDSLEKMEEASKTVFTRVEDMYLKSDDNHTENKAEHTQTRDQVKEAMGAFEGLKDEVSEYQPKILEAVRDVLTMVDQHFEHSKTSVNEMQEKISQKIEEAKPEPLMLPPPPEKYDDSGVHEKLDKLVDHTATTDKSLEQLGTLEKVHSEVVKTAAELSAFLASQTQRIEDDHEDMEKTLQETVKNLHETNVALERRLAQKDQAEVTIVDLQMEEDRLRESIAGLKVEQESLVRQKVRLTGDVSSLETALKLRREELHEMEARAEGLERRILEGVMDQSRILLMAKSSKKARETRDIMSRKRVTSKQQPAEDSIPEEKPVAPSKSGGHHQTAFKTAVNSKRSSLQPPKQTRRILSLSQLVKQPGLNAAAVTGGAGFKRSQSVKTFTGAGALRKSSWNGRANDGKKGYGDLHTGDEGDKENVNMDVVALRESDEEGFDETPASEHPGGEVVLVGGGGGVVGASELSGSTLSDNWSDPGTESLVDGGTESIVSGRSEADGREGDQSDTETLRRSSVRSGSVTGSDYTDARTEEQDPYDTYSDSGSDWTESAVGSSVVTGSAVSGSESEIGLGATSTMGDEASSVGGQAALLEG
ncbi:putative chromosome segregation atpase [Diaporthe ampelina]|uniref:Putative chromosome segregation atpase n=1 Tax=Diaporthe ampelina TaxID=1214573 RepID=A0A0G2F9F3_9PEZI|nr:putative chromosome segregation atpase [Diaporthe ampelina]